MDRRDKSRNKRTAQTPGDSPDGGPIRRPGVTALVAVAALACVVLFAKWITSPDESNVPEALGAGSEDGDSVEFRMFETSWSDGSTPQVEELPNEPETEEEALAREARERWQNLDVVIRGAK